MSRSESKSIAQHREGSLEVGVTRNGFPGEVALTSELERKISKKEKNEMEKQIKGICKIV